ncbi:MAG: Crp/Fnr family transcriptional regulator [Erythrobacter sp.]|uniref:Crp/Fnr family transcriptional regulator n=1 Tax=Erythrobacter sp. TaxID=1042 RepID=UPI003267DF22
MHAVKFKPRAFLAHQGEECSKFWLILDGTVQFRAISFEGQNTVISSFGPGELIGAYSCPKAFNFDICVLSPMTALEVSATTLSELVTGHSDIGAGLSRIYAGQLDVVLDRFSSRVSLSAVGRFYKELLRATEGRDTVSPPPVIASLALIAQTTRETGSRALGNLERRGIVERGHDYLKIVSRGMLEDLVV